MAYGLKRVTIDGLEVSITTEPTMSIARKQKSEIEVLCGDPGISVKRKMPYCELEFLLPAGKKSTDFHGKSDVIVQAETEDGRTFFWSEAEETSESSDIKATEGKITVKYLSNNSGEL